MVSVHPGKSMPRWARVLAAVAIGLLLLGPVAALTLSPWGANAMWVFFGMLPSVMGLLVSVKHAAITAVVTALLVAAALALSGVPWAGALLMAAVGVGIGLSATRGWHLIGAAIGPTVAVALISQPRVATGQGVMLAAGSGTAMLATAAWVAGGGLWVALLGVVIARVLHPRPRARVAVRTAVHFAIGLGILAAAASYVCLRWLDPMSWWILLTIFVVMRPDYATASRRTASRVVGTIVAAAAVLVTLIGRAFIRRGTPPTSP